MLAVTLRENALTTLDALKTSLGIDPAEEDAQRDATLVQLINAASAWLETQLGRKLGKSTYRQKYCGTGTQMLSLEQYPIVSVERITDTFTGETITDFDFNETGEIGVLFREDGWTYRGHIGGLAYDYIAPRKYLEVQYDLLQRHNEDPEAHAGIIMDAVGSAMKKLEESGQIMDQKTVETMIRKEIAEHGSGGYYGTYFLTLAASGWEQADEESPDYSYIYTAELPDSTSALIPSGAPLLGSFHIAEDAGVVNGCETGDGVVKFYSKEIPAADISTCIILFGKGGGGESDLTVATREQLGHVKIGNGIEVTEDGTISANAKVSEDQIATSDDTSEMLKEIYGE